MTIAEYEHVISAGVHRAPDTDFTRSRVCIFFGAFVIFMCILLHV